MFEFRQNNKTKQDNARQDKNKIKQNKTDEKAKEGVRIETDIVRQKHGTALRDWVTGTARE